MPTTLTLSDLVWQRYDDLPTGTTAYDGVVPTKPDTEQYAVYYPGPGSPLYDRQGGGSVSLDWDFRTVCCGSTRQQALNVVDQVRALYDGWSPFAGAMFTEAADGAPLIPDVSVPSDIRFSLTLRYTLTTTRS